MAAARRTISARSAGTRVIHCLHPNGSIGSLAHEPKAGESPALLLQIRAQQLCPPLKSPRQGVVLGLKLTGFCMECARAFAFLILSVDQ